MVFQDIRETQTLDIWQTLGRQAEQESSDETARDNDVFLHKLCGLKETTENMIQYEKNAWPILDWH